MTMRTVKEVSELTGVSVRTLRYYDEIGLLKPSRVTEAGYRLYGEEKLAELQQILIFRELELPLSDIRAILADPGTDRHGILARQRKLLVLKKERMERIIAGIDAMERGEEAVDFRIFDEEDLSVLFASLKEGLDAEQRQVFADRYGSEEAWREHFLESGSDPKAQENFAKMAEWYGGKEKAMAAALESPGAEVMAAYAKRLEEIQAKLAALKGTDAASFEVKRLVGEYGFVASQLYRMEDVSALLLETAASYMEEGPLQQALDAQYGTGSAAFIGEAFRGYYGNDKP